MSPRDETGPAGMYYGRTPAGRLVEIGPQLGDAEPDVWICRRVADYPDGCPPAAATTGTCTQCGAAIAYNAGAPVRAPRACMQCAGITPLPVDCE